MSPISRTRRLALEGCPIQPMQQVQETRDKNFSYVSMYRLADKKLSAGGSSLRDDAVCCQSMPLLGLDKTGYELDGAWTQRALPMSTRWI